MDKLSDLLKGKRNIRQYQDREVSEVDLRQILEAIQCSYSIDDIQCSEVIVIKDPTTKKELQGILLPDNSPSEALIQAPVVLAMCAKPSEPITRFENWFMFEVGLATQNLCLAAHSLGLGTVIIGEFDRNKAKKFLGGPQGL
jgi:nitroreductase